MLEFLKANDLKQVCNIVLIHLSEGNANPELFERVTQETTGKPVQVAKTGKEISLNLNPF
jgi:hypothetical protein